MSHASASAASQLHPSARQMFRAHKVRWTVLAVYGCASFLSALLWVQLAAIYDTAAALFHGSAPEINAFSLCYMLAYAPAAVLALVLSEAAGLRSCLLLGIAALVAASTLRWGGSMMASGRGGPRAGLALALFGQSLAAVGQPLILNAPPRIAGDFFPSAERDLVTVAGTVFNTAGMIVGSALPPALITDAASLQLMLLWTIFPCIALLIAGAVWLRDRPPSPPSAAAALQWARAEQRRAGVGPATALSATEIAESEAGSVESQVRVDSMTREHGECDAQDAAGGRKGTCVGSGSACTSVSGSGGTLSESASSESALDSRSRSHSRSHSQAAWATESRSRDSHADRPIDGPIDQDDEPAVANAAVRAATGVAIAAASPTGADVSHGSGIRTHVGNAAAQPTITTTAGGRSSAALHDATVAHHIGGHNKAARKQDRAGKAVAMEMERGIGTSEFGYVIGRHHDDAVIRSGSTASASSSAGAIARSSSRRPLTSSQRMNMTFQRCCRTGNGCSALRSALRTARHSLRHVASDGAHLLRDRDVMLLTASFSAGIGAAWCLLTVQAQLLTPCGYTAAMAGASGAILLAVGSATSFGLGALMSRARAHYATIQKVAMALATAAVVFALAVNRPGQVGLVFGAWATAGATLQPLLPLSLEHAAEMTHPVSPDTAAALLLSGANIVGAALVLALGPLLQAPVSAACSSVVTPAAGVLLAFMVAGLALTMPIRRSSRRSEAEAAHAMEEQRAHAEEERISSEAATPTAARLEQSLLQSGDKVGAAAAMRPAGGPVAARAPTSAVAQASTSSGAQADTARIAALEMIADTTWCDVPLSP